MANKDKTRTEAARPQDVTDEDYDSSVPIPDSEVMPMLPPEDAAVVHDASLAAATAEDEVLVSLRLPRKIFARIEEAARHRTASTGTTCTAADVILDIVKSHWGAHHSD